MNCTAVKYTDLAERDKHSPMKKVKKEQQNGDRCFKDATFFAGS